MQKWLLAVTAVLTVCNVAAFAPSTTSFLQRHHTSAGRTCSQRVHTPVLRAKSRGFSMRMGLNEELWEAAECNELELVEDLVGRGSDVNSANDQAIGKTALHYAAFQGHAMVIAKLIDLGANPNTQTVTGSTALHYCAAYGHFTAINYLVQLGADRKIKNDSGETPLDIAKFKGKFGDRADFKEVVKLLETGRLQGPEGKYMDYGV